MFGVSLRFLFVRRDLVVEREFGDEGMRDQEMGTREVRREENAVKRLWEDDLGRWSWGVELRRWLLKN